jgi:hypothetical protein
MNNNNISNINKSNTNFINNNISSISKNSNGTINKIIDNSRW